MNQATRQALVAWPILMTQLFAFGTAAFTLIIAPPDPHARRKLEIALAPWWRGLSLALVILSPLGLLVEASNMAGVSLGKALALLPEVLSETHVGRMWAWRLGFVLLFVAAGWAPLRTNRRSVAILVVSAALLLLGGLSSHAIDHGAQAVAIYVVHEAAAALWVGALAGLWLGYARVSPSDRWVERAAPRVSRVAGWCVALVVLTGLYNAYDALGVSLGDLLYSAYGRTLLLKVALFGVVLALGGFNRYRLVPRLEQARTRALLLRNVTVEAALLVGVLGIAALLANTAPAHHP